VDPLEELTALPAYRLFGTPSPSSFPPEKYDPDDLEQRVESAGPPVATYSHEASVACNRHREVPS